MMSDDLALFDMDRAEQAAAEPKLSEGRRRTLRQMAALDRKRHPLSLLYSVPLPLHPDAPDPHERSAPGPRCGTCMHRTTATSNGNRSFAKCGRETAGSRPYVTFSAASDLRSWWPGCTHYQAAA